MPGRRPLRAWARNLAVAPGTLRNWTDSGLAYEAVGRIRMIDEGDLRAFLSSRPGLGKSEQALRRLEGRPADESGRSDEARRSSDATDLGPEREALRQLRAQVATLDEELAKAQADNDRLGHERDLWRARARAHRHTLRAQLDLEEQADAGT